MASAFDAMFASSAVPVLSAWHGSLISRWPSGLQEYATSVTAMWAPVNAGTREASVNEQANIKRGTITLLADTECGHRDSWVIDGVRYATETMGPVTGGLRYIQVVRADEYTTSRQVNVR